MTSQPMRPGLRAALSLQYPMSLGVYDSYEEAQKAVDYLSDNEFPVQDVLIVGTDLKNQQELEAKKQAKKEKKAFEAAMAKLYADQLSSKLIIDGRSPTDLKQLERVTGRLTRGRVLGAGALSGAWLGLFVGTIFALFDPSGFNILNVVSTVAFGALFGMVWAAVGYRLTRGERDFTSVSQVVAAKYEVLCEHKHVQRGRELLTEMDPMRAAMQEVRRAQEAERARADEA